MSRNIPLFLLLGVMCIGAVVLISVGVQDSAPRDGTPSTTADWYEIRKNAQARLPASARPVASAPPWYEGGTLHDRTFGQWNAATARNRLATAGDWIARIQLSEYEEVSDPDGSRMRELASDLRDCVDRTTEGADAEYGLAAKPVSDAASMCLVMMWGTTPPSP